MSGDGWTVCALGHRHWGRFGAAGLLIVRGSDVLLQLRSTHVHNGGTWSIPGGARDRAESAAQAALRESAEEIGLRASDVRPGAEFVDDHGGWSYTTVIAPLVVPFVPRNNHESSGTAWVASSRVTELPLHNGFAHTWPRVAELVDAVLPRP
ncbi:ADP-ribose pyrophosphatase YjhB, NUDIX family [Nakamurella panacisegetis]|uniref:ADP-ribose pyrophosphatase YjhB, NUDIX family n=1 Tax=Nakamurella panacisegetis TaxID=1090615 RepID=A0A1H0N4V9_9ACTN|nr:NUDIX hydrolase [Nakamurella panacisegetis]SDO87718.1 ADP-ribose pyrophosphatase YjhB, NUDIX family [Nakamurella panacisegetis]